MTKIVVAPGICGLKTIIEVSQASKRKFEFIIASDCEALIKLGKSLAEVDQWDVVKQYVDCHVLKAASRCQVHVIYPCFYGYPQDNRGRGQAYFAL